MFVSAPGLPIEKQKFVKYLETFGYYEIGVGLPIKIKIC